MDRAEVQHTYAVLDAVSVAQGAFEDAETGQRGCLITGDESYLAPYRRAVARVDGDLAALAALTADNPEQRQAVQRLQAPVRDKLVELADTIGLRRTGGFEAARSVVVTGRGLIAMTSIRALLDQLRTDEEALLARRLDDSARRNHETRLLMAWGSLVAVMAVGAGAWLVARSLTVRPYGTCSRT